MPAIGLIVEGVYDQEVLAALIPRILEQPVELVVRVCGGKVSGRFLRLLKELRYQNPEKIIVLSDTDDGDPQAMLAEFQRQIQNQDYPFPVKFALATKEMEAWLLADPQAIDQVCPQRGIPQNFVPLTNSPEEIHDPKKKLQVMLGKAGVQYTKVRPGYCGECES